MPSKCPICGVEHATLEELQEKERASITAKEVKELPKKKSKKSSMSSYEDS